MKRKTFIYNLQKFNDGGGAGAGAGAASAPGAEGASNGVSSQETTVVYGKQPGEGIGNPENEPTNVSEPGSEPGNEPGGEEGNEPGNEPLPFKELLKQTPAYKQEVEKLVQNRIKNINQKAQQLEQELNSQNEMLLTLYSRYGVREGDKEGLQAALAKDTSYLQEEADLKGIDVQQLQYLKQMELQNAMLKRQQQQAQEQWYMQQQQARWKQESEVCKQKYPDFDLVYELNNNPDFERLIISNVPVVTAYETIHMNEIIQNQTMQAAKTVEQQVTTNLKTKQARPTENAATNMQTGILVKDNPKNWTKEDRKRVEEMVMKGQKVYL